MQRYTISTDLPVCSFGKQLTGCICPSETQEFLQQKTKLLPPLIHPVTGLQPAGNSGKTYSDWIRDFQFLFSFFVHIFSIFRQCLAMIPMTFQSFRLVSQRHVGIPDTWGPPTMLFGSEYPTTSSVMPYTILTLYLHLVPLALWLPPRIDFETSLCEAGATSIPPWAARCHPRIRHPAHLWRNAAREAQTCSWNLYKLGYVRSTVQRISSAGM